MRRGDLISWQLADFFYSDEYNNLPKSQRIGLYGQYLGKIYLQKKGYEVLAENYYLRAGELDIVMRFDSKIHVIEVKTRTSERQVEAQTAIHQFKRASLRRSATQFMSLKGWLYEIPFQIDGLIVVIDEIDKKIRFRYYPNIVTEQEE